MRDLNNIVKKSGSMDLLNVHQWLESKYGTEAPSYMTLRRWAKSGSLHGAVIDEAQAGQRTRYSPVLVEHIFQQSNLGRKATSALIQARGKPERVKVQAIQQMPAEAPSELSTRLDIVAETLARVVQMQVDHGEMLKTCLTSLSRLDSLRTNLMLKYDAQTSLQSELIENLRAQLKASTKSTDLEQTVLRLGIQLGRIKDSIDALGDRPIH